MSVKPGQAHVDDRHVLMVISGAGIKSQIVSSSVETTQVAPTVLSLLGLDPSALDAVRIEGTRALPGT